MRRRVVIIIVILGVLIFSFGLWLHSNYTVPVLMYHSFNKNLIGKYAAVSLDTFSKQMSFIKKRGYKVVSLDEYCLRLKRKERLPHNLVVITSDDGWKDNLQAIKILNKYGFPATIFLIVNNIGKEGYLSKEDIRWFLDNTKVRLGSHTLTHAYLPQTPSPLLKKEINESKEVLEKLFSVKVNTISYPVGGFNKEVLEEVERAGYLCGCTTNRGFSRKLNIFALRRIKITERDLGFRLWAKLSGFYNLFKRVKNPY